MIISVTRRQVVNNSVILLLLLLRYDACIKCRSTTGHSKHYKHARARVSCEHYM